MVFGILLCNGHDCIGSDDGDDDVDDDDDNVGDKYENCEFIL